MLSLTLAALLFIFKFNSSLAFGSRGGYDGSVGGFGGGVGGQGGYLPVGYAMLDGEMVDMSNKMVQRVGGGGGGTQYFAWTDQKGPPVFRRREIDTGRRFIVFPDRNYPPGDGHYVVLRRFMHGRTVRRGGNIYEAFYLDLGDSINAMVTNFNSLSPAAPGLLGGSTGGRRVLSAGGLRMKRHMEASDTPMQIAEILYLRKPSHLANVSPKTIDDAVETLNVENASKKEVPIA